MTSPMLRRLLLLGLSPLFSTTLTLTLSSAAAETYSPPATYGQPYRPYSAPSYAGGRRALDNSYRSVLPMWQPNVWQGLYVGGHGGYTWGSATPVGSGETLDLNGGALGLHAGYNWQRGNFVVGFETDGTWNNAKGRQTFAGPVDVDGRNDWTSSLRLRTGYAHGNTLFYVTGGAAFAGYDVRTNDGFVAERARETLFGYAAGGGVEMKFSQNVSGRIEALYYGFGDKTFHFPSGNTQIDPSTTTVRAGLTYHFN